MAVRAKTYGILAGVATIFALLFAPQSSYAAGRVSLSPTPINLTEGQSQVVTVTLTEPIIAMSGTPFVTLVITATNPERITSSVSSVTWSATQWMQPRSFTLTASDDLLVNGDVNDAIEVSVEANSEFYANFAPSFLVNVLDNEVASQNPTQDQPNVLPRVGSGLYGTSALAFASLSCLFAFILHRRAKIDI